MLAMEFQREVDRMRARLERFALGYTRDREDARDIAQDAIVRAYQRCAGIRGNLFGFLCECVRSVAYNASERKTPILISLDEAPHPADTSQDMETTLLLRDDLGRAFRSIDRQQAQSFLLVHRKGCSYQEAAESLGTTVAAVKARVHTAKRRLAAILKDESAT